MRSTIFPFSSRNSMRGLPVAPSCRTRARLHYYLRAMRASRRSFMRWAASVSALAVADRPSLWAAGPGDALRPDCCRRRKRSGISSCGWRGSGRNTPGNAAHTTFVEFLATELKRIGVDVARERYTFPRWDARQWEIAVAPASGAAFKAPVTSCFPYSGQTTAAGVTGELVFAGRNLTFTLEGLQGKVALLECPINTRQWSEQHKVWGLHPTDEKFPTATRPARGPVGDLTPIPEGWRRRRHPGVDRHLGRQRRGPARRFHVRRRTSPGSTSDATPARACARSQARAPPRQWSSKRTCFRTRRQRR